MKAISRSIHSSVEAYHTEPSEKPVLPRAKEYFVEDKSPRRSLAGDLNLRIGEKFGEMNIRAMDGISATVSILSIRERGF